MTTMFDFENQKYIIISKIENDLYTIMNHSRFFENLYVDYKKSNFEEKTKLKMEAKDILQAIHDKFSNIENSLRDFERLAKEKNVELTDEDDFQFDDEIQLKKEDYQEFKKLDVNIQRFVIWIELFIKKIKQISIYIRNDLKNNKKIEKKLKVLHEFYRQIYVIYKVINNDSFMQGSPLNKIILV